MKNTVTCRGCKWINCKGCGVYYPAVKVNPDIPRECDDFKAVEDIRAAPCKNCITRYLNCHSVCKFYREWQELCKVQKEERAKFYLYYKGREREYISKINSKRTKAGAKNGRWF